MLSHEDAQKRLEPLRIKNWHKDRLAEIGGLPEKLRAIAYGLFDRGPDGKQFKDWRKTHDARTKGQEGMIALSPKDRGRIFSLLFPKLADTLEAAWQLIPRLPYETSSDRKGFRAPSDPKVYHNARKNWLHALLNTLPPYDQDAEWLAAYAPYISSYYAADCVGLILAAAIDAGGEDGEKVFEILKESASNQHEVGSMGRHVTRAMLVCNRPDAWEFVEKLLLAAQRQEGLRQVILESVDECHPEAFKRMLRLVLSHNLIRFAATVRAIDTWFGLQWDALTPAVLKRTVETVIKLLDDPAYRAEVIAADKGEPLYLALWANGFEDAHKAVAPAVALLKDPAVERRYLAMTFLRDLDLDEGKKHLYDLLEDPDLRIATSVIGELPAGPDAPDIWDRLVALMGRMPAKRQQGESLVWPWVDFDIDRGDVAGLLVERLGKRPATALIPYLSNLASYQRGNVAEMLAKMKKWDAATRDTLFQLTGDKDGWVRQKALTALKKCEVTAEDAVRVEALLVRKSSEMRQGVLALLMKQKLPQVMASADRLLASKKAPQKQSGLELLRALVEKKKAVEECRKRATAYKEQAKSLSEEEELHLEVIHDVKREKPTLDNALGLMDPAQRTKPVEPVAKKVVACTPAAVETLKSLDALVASHKKTPVRLPGYQGEQEELLGNVQWGFPDPDTHVPIAEDLVRLPLREVWEKWYADRPKTLIDKDGYEIARAFIWHNIDAAQWKGTRKTFGKKYGKFLDLVGKDFVPVKMKYPGIVRSLLEWFLRMHPPEGVHDFSLDLLETAYSYVPADERVKVVDQDNWQKRQQDWRNNSPAETWASEVESFRGHLPESWTEAHLVRLYDLQHWRDQPAPGVFRFRPDLDEFLAGVRAGHTNDHDHFDHLIGPQLGYMNDLATLSAYQSPQLAATPKLVPVIDRIRERVIEIELARGEMETAASPVVRAISSIPGSDTLFRVLATLGKKAPARGGYGTGRTETLSQMIVAGVPLEGDTPEAFAARAKKDGVTKERLLQVAFLCPGWLDHIGAALGWDGFKEGVWWFLAHMDGARRGVGVAGNDEYDLDEDDDEFDDDDTDDETGETRQPRRQREDPWARVIRERSPLTDEDRRRGAVDAAWFYRVFNVLGRKKWDLLAEAAKYGTTWGNAAKKATFLSDVLLGRVKRNLLIDNVRNKKLKESVRLLGLLPLPDGAKRENELLARYKVLVEYRRYARSLSMMSKEDAENTARIGLENLARTAGYPDPIRLEWAMEGKQIADLAKGPISVTQDGVTVTLSITDEAQPEINVRRGERVLKQCPPATKKNPKIANLYDRRADLKRQGSRVKYSLEAMMIRGDTFTGRELRQLAIHPLLRPFLEKLVLVGENLAGYPVAEGTQLEDHAGKSHAVKLDDVLRIAHPHDLYASGQWAAWQADVFKRERVQPFKQVFRELYLVTQAEREEEENISERYAEQQVNPTQSKALLGNRGWRVQDDIEKTFYEANIVAEVRFRHSGYTPLQVEGLTFDNVRFRRRGDYELLPLDEVPPRVFSEVMRDCDLVVSVAHVGGVDPEASQSTVEMRASLIRETTALLGITNYEIKSRHILIHGVLGEYSIHLGSGVVHKMPGGSVAILPVHAQHRGRLFLPFADDDPRTAEIISKILLLARDKEIQDPTILDQLR